MASGQAQLSRACVRPGGRVDVRVDGLSAWASDLICFSMSDGGQRRGGEVDLRSNISATAFVIPVRAGLENANVTG